MDKKAFNDVDEHLQKYVDTPNLFNLKQMPSQSLHWIRNYWFYRNYCTPNNRWIVI